MEDLIKINKCEEVVDNWGNTEQYKDAELFKLLTTPEDWTDDQIFLTDEGEYYIDDLIGKRVQVGTYIFTVQED
jgi:ribosomal 30S subunit maturation factor RimM